MKELIFESIKKWDSIIILRHVRPDPDAYGSQAGLKELIKEHFPHKSVFMVGEQEESLSFLAEMDQVEDEVFSKSLVIICDTANRERIDDERYKNSEFIIKIDHHPEVDVYGNLSWVDEKASSTSEMICELYKEFEKDGAILTNKAAKLLYAGIVGDTGRFRFSNTSERTFYWAGKLIEKDFSSLELYDKMYETSLSLLRLEGYVLSNLDLRPSGVGVVYLTKEKLEEFGVTANESAAIVNSFSSLKGIKAWVFFVEEDEKIIRVRLRSKGPEIHHLASRFNGGGHPLASGAQVSSWDEAEVLIEELDNICS
ncbi:bifunctional oligoribonuclease/PAP phosphatase NrnA [Evansella sp. AB-P1]|uniref:DHH family phosphoesterase n=1 Tax=Evansella sp. AB-P1 TaxID=3037653 RepID=UPI00241D5950|nr:bifunctional oligoribonuclease/PAP phosphatase NrnA [Evansella sp. AB-P1]MDG5786990.1 bifunctional oligoribonuclease/PAP phosphatase NrnA [Evansella sp. AB-P1]